MKSYPSFQALSSHTGILFQSSCLSWEELSKIGLQLVKISVSKPEGQDPYEGSQHQSEDRDMINGEQEDSRGE